MNDTKDRPLRISDLEAITGLSRRTIHYYMSEGLLSPPLRTGKTMAYYNVDHVNELENIKNLKEEGYPIALIKKMTRNDEEIEKNTERERGSFQARRKQQIMEKAVEIFSKIGYHKATINDITRAVGVGPSTFYLYFPSKKALFMECVDKVFQSMITDMIEEISKEKNPLRRLRVRGEVILKSHTQFIDILQVLSTTIEDDPHLEAKRREIYALILDPVKKNLQRAINEDLFPPMDLEIVGYILIGLMETAKLVFSLNDRFTVDDFLDTVDKLIFYR